MDPRLSEWPVSLDVGMLMSCRCEDVVRVVEATKVKPVVSKVYPFEEAKDALKFLEGHGHVGKIVVTVCKD